MDHALHAPIVAAGTLSAFLLGLVGSIHCVVMCGGLATAVAGDPTRGLRRSAARILLRTSGRILGYTLAGTAAGTLGAGLTTWWGDPAGLLVRTALGTALVLAGVAVAASPRTLRALERSGAHAWRHLAPLTRGLRPLDRAWKLFALGTLWALLPCGLLYTALAGAAATGHPALGATWMAAFGLGTVPAVAGLGTFVAHLGRLTRPHVTAGVTLVALGAWTVLGAFALQHGGAPHG